MKIFHESKEESPIKEKTEKHKTEESALTSKLNKLCEQPLGSKKSSVYSSGQSKLLLNVYSNNSNQRLKRKL